MHRLVYKTGRTSVPYNTPSFLTGVGGGATILNPLIDQQQQDIILSRENEHMVCSSKWSKLSNVLNQEAILYKQHKWSAYYERNAYAYSQTVYWILAASKDWIKQTYWKIMHARCRLAQRGAGRGLRLGDDHGPRQWRITIFRALGRDKLRA